MKQLSDTLEAMKSAGALQKAQPHGLTTTGGQSVTSPRNLPVAATPIQNQQIMNALCSLASVGAKTVENGHFGIAKDGQYDFIATGPSSLVPVRTLTQDEIIAVDPLLAPANVDLIRIHVGRLALIKKIGNASELTMSALLTDLAFELAEFSQLAVLLAFREIKREEGPWMPELGVLIKRCEKWQGYVDALYAQNKFENLRLAAQ